MKRYLAAVSAALLLVTVLAPAAMAKTAKVDICHYDAVTGSYALTSVPAGKPLQAHLAHGDAYPGDPVPTMPGYEFDAGCSIVGGDADLDGVLDAADNCPSVANRDQSDRYGSGKGDACEDDSDGDGTLDVNEASICVSINGAVVVAARGGAICWSNLTSGSQPNITVAHGDAAYAYALNGNNNTAIATGDRAEATALNGDNNTATATGVDANASADYGDNNTATAAGAYAYAYANDGNDNTAIATGDGAIALATDGNDNTAIATGDGAYATARYGNNNTASAIGDGEDASATAAEGCTVLNGICP